MPDEFANRLLPDRARVQSASKAWGASSSFEQVIVTRLHVYIYTSLLRSSTWIGPRMRRRRPMSERRGRKKEMVGTCWLWQLEFEPWMCFSSVLSTVTRRCLQCLRGKRIIRVYGRRRQGRRRRGCCSAAVIFTDFVFTFSLETAEVSSCRERKSFLSEPPPSLWPQRAATVLFLCSLENPNSNRHLMFLSAWPVPKFITH